MMLQPTPEVQKMHELIDEATDENEIKKLCEELKRLLIEQDKALDNLPFVH